MDLTFINLTFVIQSFVALFVIVDPFGNVPIFIALLEGFKKSDRISMIQRSILVAAISLIIFTLSGNMIFKFFGINIYSFKIAGGILLLIISIEMLFGRKTMTEASKDMEEEKEDVAITPLAIPLLTGPGAITTGIVLFDNAGNYINRIFLIFNIIVVFLISYFILSKSNLIFKVLRRTGTKVITRIMGLILSAISIQFILSGISEAVIALNIF